MSVEVILQAENLTKTFKRGRNEVVRALEDINFKLYEAEMILLYGPSGSGKSTLLNLLSGIDTPTSGKIEFMGKDLTTLNEKKLTQIRREHIGFIFQSWELIDGLTAAENVEVPMYAENVSLSELRTDVITLLRRLDLMDREDHFPAELSGGEQQRVAIARALIKKPKIIFADEPTGNLDLDTGEMIMRMLKTICRQGTSVIVATHNDALQPFADRVLRLTNGKLS